jgi:ADP-heptose:LPS heptosyltransferase
MRIITFSKRVTVATRCAGYASEITCNPGERLVFNDDNSLSIQQDPGSARYIDSVTDLAPYLQELNARIKGNWRGKRVLFYRNRGIGDQLIASSLPHFFSEMLGAECFVAIEPNHLELWNANPYAKCAVMPLHLDVFYRAKLPSWLQGAFIFESVSEWDSDSEQANVYDRLFGMVGLDPARVAPKFKRPVIALTKTDLDYRASFQKKVAQALNVNSGNGYILFAPSATSKVRSLPLPIVEKALYALSDYAGKLELPIFVVDDKALSSEIAQTVKRIPNAVNLAGAINSIRLLISLIAGANVVLGPDSAALHIAAAFEVPAIGIWGPFSPNSRCAYYPRQIHLFHPEVCPNAPCFNYLPDLPITKCPRGLEQPYCEVFDPVTVEEIFEALKNVSS